MGALGQHFRHERFGADCAFHRDLVEVDEGRDPVRHDAAFLTLDRLLYSDLRTGALQSAQSCELAPGKRQP